MTLTLTPGIRIGSYEIIACVGAGGMGEVYRASDTKLKREVAIKVLPAAVASDPERLARFQREAELLASLNHPNIAAIHGLEETSGSNALVMELVDGLTLAERIAFAGRIKWDEAVALAIQIAEAAAAAHERGVIHRDLKPSNIMVRRDGTVKVLDFGIAKAMSPLLPYPLEQPPVTVTDRAGGFGAGTPAYMSPEQVRGAAGDHRADIWALGCILYEMLTGRAVFAGESTPDVLTRVLHAEPDWERLPARLPPSIRRVLRLCLEKNPSKRRQSAGDVRIDLELARTEPEPDSHLSRSRISRAAIAAWSTAAVVLIALAIPASVHLREAAPTEVRLQILTPPTSAPLDFALSPDGRHIVYVAAVSSDDDTERLLLRASHETEARPLPNTDGARQPFWSPDNRSIGFFAEEKLLRIDLTGGPAEPLAAAVNPLGGAWGPDGTILFAPDSVSPLFRVPDTGGTPVPVTDLASLRHANHRRPAFLPDGRRFVFYAAAEPERSGLYLGSLDGEAPKRLAAADDTAAVVVASDRMVFAREGALVARRLDRRGALIGEIESLVPAPSAGGDQALKISASTTGMLAFRRGSAALRETTWVDRAGNLLEPGGSDMNGPELSPDGLRVAYDRTVAGNRDVWILDLARGSHTRFTTHPAVDGYPSWSPDGRQLVFESQRNGTFDLWIKPASGADEERLLLGTRDEEIPIDWSDDGRFLLYRSSDASFTHSDLWALPMTGEDRTPISVASTRFAERMADFSPDGRWVAYDTDESGRFEIRVQAFPEPAGWWAVSIDGGVAPRWTTGGEISFVAPDGTMMAARVTATEHSFTAEKPEPLFSTRIAIQAYNHQYAVSSDGRFLVNNRQTEDSVAPITVLLNWRPWGS